MAANHTSSVIAHNRGPYKWREELAPQVAETTIEYPTEGFGSSEPTTTTSQGIPPVQK
jgi:hypothetical protein